MPVDRQLWREWFKQDCIPAWPCGRCGRAGLALVENTYHQEWDAETRKDRGSESYNPMDCSGYFVAMLHCRGCQERCAVAGRIVTDVEVDDKWEQSYVSLGRPKSISPAPSMIQIPRECPDPVRSEIRLAFALYWNDLGACLNRIRFALEELLSHLRVPNSTLSKSKKRVRLAAHDRIEKLRSMKPGLNDICDRMMAVKHLGNAGSHPGVDVTEDDVFDGLDILERVLHDMYSSHETVLARMVRQINKRKGPRKAK